MRSCLERNEADWGQPFYKVMMRGTLSETYGVLSVTKRGRIRDNHSTR